MLTRPTLCALLALISAGCSRHASPPAAHEVSQPPSQCLADRSGYLRLRAGGAVDLNLDWTDAQLECDGNPRPDSNGLRLTFAGLQPAEGHRVRLVIGLAAAPGAGTLHAIPANVTLILEGEDRIFATRGDQRCTVDELVQSAIGAHAWRLAGRGFCSTPAASLDGRQNLLISRFDFAGRAVDAEPGDHRE